MIYVLKSFIKKEFTQIKRDKRMLFFIFVPPLIQLLILGYALNFDIKNIDVCFCDLEKTSESREILRKLSSSGYFRIKYYLESCKKMDELLDKGKVKVGIKIDKNFSKKKEIQIIIDGTDVNTASISKGYLKKIFYEKFERKNPEVNFELRVWYNPELKSQNYNVPGIVAFLIMLTCLLLTSMSIVKERESGTLEQILVTPLKPIEFIIGKTIPFAIIGFFEMSLALIFAILVFKIPLKGSILFLFFSALIYILSFLGIGLFISTISKTMQQAMMLSFFILLPTIILSGFLFPIENMPLLIQYITYLNPLRYFLIIIRGIFLKGIGLSILWKEILILLFISTAISSLSILNFRKRIK